MTEAKPAGAGGRGKVVFVSYGAFDSNSAGHVFGFANGLSALGHPVAVCATGLVSEAYSYGRPAFEFFTVDQLADAPESVLGFDGAFETSRTTILCWTPREVVRRAVEPVVQRHGCRYLVHLEDNEEHLAKVWGNTRKAAALWKRSANSARSDLSRLRPFLAGAAGITLIEHRLEELVPAGVPTRVLEPGVDLVELAEPLPPSREATMRTALGVAADAPLIVYPGNVHRANVEDMRQLYEAVQLLRERDVVLVRTGQDFVDAAFLKKTGVNRGIIPLGHVPRRFLIDLMKCADLFVQPGAPGPFNDYRLPSKLPEFMAIGRPIVLPATNVGARLRHREDAMLLQEGSAREIANHVAAVLDDTGLLARLAANARRFAERHYRWDQQVRKLEAFLREVA